MKTNKCIKNLLKLICLLQKNSENNNSLNDTCTKPYLGPTINNICYNTRVITLYNKNGTLLTSNYNINNTLEESSLFRVENISDDCVTLRILTKDNNTYKSTNNFITVNINCICAIKCIEDTIISNL